MKKISKMLALGLALAMTFGMSVSAAESDNTSKEQAGNAAEAAQEAAKKADGIVGKDGKVYANTVYVNSIEDSYLMNEYNVERHGEYLGKNYTEATEKAQKSEAISAAISKAAPEGKKVDSEKTTTEVIDVNVALPVGGASIPLKVAEEGKVYVIGHYNQQSRMWESIQTEVKDGYVWGFFTYLSPVSITTLTLVNDDTTVPENPTVSNVVPSSDPGNYGGDWLYLPWYEKQVSGTPVSPKTGETLPVAGMMALLCLAGAAVCVKKARCNN